MDMNWSFKVPVHEESETSVNPDSKLDRGNMLHAIKLAIKSRVLIVRFVIIVYNWITNAFVYYGLSLNSVSLSGNKYLNYTLVCLIEIPGYTISWVSKKDERTANDPPNDPLNQSMSQLPALYTVPDAKMWTSLVPWLLLVALFRHLCGRRIHQ